MTTLIIWGVAFIVCIAIIIVALRFDLAWLAQILLFILLLIIIFFVGQCKGVFRYNGTTVEKCSDLLEVNTFPADKNNGILMISLDNEYANAIVELSLSDGDTYSESAVDGIFAIVLPSGSGTLKEIKFDYRSFGSGNMSMYSKVEFNEKFLINPGKLTYLGNISRRLNPNRHDFTSKKSILEDNTYYYYIEKDSIDEKIRRLLKPWGDLGRLRFEKSFLIFK